MRTLFDRRLEAAGSILFAGCGGGFDVYTSIPLAIHAMSLGKRVSFANLSFSRLSLMGGERVGPTGVVIEPDMPRVDYFPELHLKRWLAGRGTDAPVYAMPVTGVAPLRDTYAAIVGREGPDLVVLADGGTDSLVKGDEEELGTIVEDATSIVALSGVSGPDRILACLGFGVDHFHGISHHRFLENVSETIRLGGFLGCQSVMAGTPEGDALLDLADHALREQPDRPSIVVTSIASALRGRFGDHHATERTADSELFVNPLMSLYWTFDLAMVASMMGYADAIRDTRTAMDVDVAIGMHHGRQAIRPSLPLPL